MTTITIQETINHLIARQDLTTAQMAETMRAIMTGACTPAQIAGFLVALRMKGETVDEISAAARVMRELSERVEVSPEHLVDTCGTGGDGSHTFNISTTAAFVTAAAGARVAKHGNRSVSSKSGSADVLEAAGINLQLGPEQVADCIEKIGIGFMFAPMHHSAMKYAITPRKELGTRTLFNLLGPLTNPAAAPNQVLGVFSEDWLEKLAQVLQKLGSEHVLVVHAEDGLDEISIAAATRICELCKGKIHQYTITPEKFGLQRNAIECIESGNVENSLEILYSVLDNTPGPARDIVTMNAGAAIYAAGIADTLESGMGKAEEAITDGSARNKLDEMKQLTNTY